MSTDTHTSQLIINKLSKSQYEAIASPSATELYLTPDTTAQDIADAVSTHNSSSSAHSTLLSAKQDTLVSGTNIKTINGTSVLGSGDITVGGSVSIDDTTITKNSNDELQAVKLVGLTASIAELNTLAGTTEYTSAEVQTLWNSIS